MQIEAGALLAEVLIEIQERGTEQRLAIEHLAGQVRIQSETIEELQQSLQKKHNTVDQTSTGETFSMDMLRQIWLRAFIFTGVFWAFIWGALYYVFS